MDLHLDDLCTILALLFTSGNVSEVIAVVNRQSLKQEARDASVVHTVPDVNRGMVERTRPTHVPGTAPSEGKTDGGGSSGATAPSWEQSWDRALLERGIDDLLEAQDEELQFLLRSSKLSSFGITRVRKELKRVQEKRAARAKVHDGAAESTRNR